MEEKLKSEGKCVYCNATFTQRTFTKHFETHFKTMAIENSTAKSYLIKAKAAEMFLFLLVNEKTNFDDLDSFFREIWLECCGHLSSFSIKREEIDMDTKISEIFQKNLKLDYQYDFGSTTHFEVHLLSEYNFATKEPVVLLSRNEPLEIYCYECKKEPAVNICTVHEFHFLCKKCSTKHAKKCEDFADYASMPVVNSPRMGTCGYEGGSIDTQRDGIFVVVPTVNSEKVKKVKSDN